MRDGRKWKKNEDDWKGKKQNFWVLQALKTHGSLGGKNQFLCRKNELIYNIYVYKLHEFWAIQRFEYVKNAQKNELVFNIESQEKFLSWQGFYRPIADEWVDDGPFSLKNYKSKFSLVQNYILHVWLRTSFLGIITAN